MILIIDDDSAIRDLVVAVLLMEGHLVAEASDGQQGLMLAASLEPELIFLDMNMPILDGWGFVVAYRALPRHSAQIIVMTAARDAARLAAEVSADGCLAKPFDIAELIRLAQHHLTVAGAV